MREAEAEMDLLLIGSTCGDQYAAFNLQAALYVKAMNFNAWFESFAVEPSADRHFFAAPL